MKLSTATECPNRTSSIGAIGAVIAGLSVYSLTLGLSYPLLALILENQGIPKTLIGLNAAMMPLGLIVSAPLIPRLAQRLGSFAFAILCIFFTMVLFGLLGAVRQIEYWFVFRFLLGTTVNGMFIVSETWINQMAAQHSRGRVMGLYTTVLALGFSIGPFILPWTGFDGWAPFLVGISSFATALLILTFFHSQLPTFRKDSPNSIISFIPLAPTLLFAVIATAYFDQVVLSFLPLYAIHQGLSHSTSVYALGVLIVGNVFLQFPLGWLADRIPRRRVMMICAGISVGGCFLLPMVIKHPYVLMPTLFVWGGAAFGTYTITLAELGDRFSGSILLTANAAFAVMWGGGGIVGPPLAGTVMELWGTGGFPFILGIPFIILIVLLGRRRQPTAGSTLGDPQTALSRFRKN